MRRYAPILALAGLLATALGLMCSGAHAQPLSTALRPPRDLAKRVARNESFIRAMRDQYTFRQYFQFEELTSSGQRMGIYQEQREVIFSPERGRAEVLEKLPSNSLKRIRLTDEDFHDVREIQNFLFTEDVLWLYQIRHQGDEVVEGEPCWVMRVSPKNHLEGMRFFEGVLWVSKNDEEIVRASGHAVPEIRTTKHENLFPAFTTVRQRIDGHWMPVRTYADDELAYSSGRQRVRLQVDFADYRRFGADSSIAFGEVPKDAASPEPKP
ncbi:MAG: hypothetical protein KIT83_07055 [Bryobacterales bacterium]|nr:hypothetical protein [Bryobacterales bacterium]